MLARADAAAARHQRVDLGAQRVDRCFEPARLAFHVVGHDLLDDHARLVEHDIAKPHPVGKGGASQGKRAVQGDVAARPDQRSQLARRDHLRQEHRRRKENLDLFFRVGAARAVLDDEHAERVAATQDRDPEKGVVDFLARFRAERKGRVVLRVVEGERFRPLRDQSDEPFAAPHRGLVDGLVVQALRRTQFQHAVGAQNIDRADLGDHVRGDVDDDAVQARLRVDRRRHDLAEPAQQ